MSFYQHIRFTQRLRERDAVGMRQNPARQAIAQPLAISVITVAARQFTIGASIICIRAAAVSVASGTIPLLNAPVQRIAFRGNAVYSDGMGRTAALAAIQGIICPYCWPDAATER